SNLLGVLKDTLGAHGPVSEPVAREMAENVRKSFGATFGVSITGNAGPTSDVDGKPVGQVFIGLAGPEDTKVDQVKYRGTREDIRRRATGLAGGRLGEALLRR